jgi:hypothetical protein
LFAEQNGCIIVNFNYQNDYHSHRQVLRLILWGLKRFYLNVNYCIHFLGMIKARRIQFHYAIEAIQYEETLITAVNIHISADSSISLSQQ